MTTRRKWTFMFAPTADGRTGSDGPFYELPNGTFFPDRSELVAMPSSYPEVPDDPFVRIRLQVKDDHRPICTSIAFEAQADGPALNASAIRDIDLGGLIEDAISFQAVAARSLVQMYGAGEPVAHPDGRIHIPIDRMLSKQQMTETSSDVLRLHRQRSVNDDLLSEVARHYLAATKAPTEAVASEMHTSKRNATRWVAMAREHGHLPPYVRSPSTPKEG